MIEKLFESLDEKVFTADLKESLETSFNEAVETKSLELAEAKISEKETELTEKFEADKAEMLKEADEKEAELLESVSSYLDKVVEEFVTEAKETMEKSIVNEKADLMVEAFDANLTAAGIEVSQIVEAKDATDVETKLAESVEKYDTLVNENIDLEKENANLIKMGVIAEKQEGLSIVEAEKFANIANLVEFTKDDAYAEKLDVIRESVIGAVETPKVDDVVVVEKVEKDNKSFAHLI